MVKIGQLTLDGTPRVAVPFRDGTEPPAIAAAQKAGMDIAELRIDRFGSHALKHVLGEIEKFRDVPLLATIRSDAEGGTSGLSDKARLELYEAIIQEVDAVDIELSSKTIRSKVVEIAHRVDKIVIVSFHDFQRTPDIGELVDIAATARDAGADIVKIAANCSSREDLRTLTVFAAEEHMYDNVIIGMGELGSATRILFPLLGSLFTFASYEEATAPGQLSLAETVRLLRTFAPESPA